MIVSCLGKLLASASQTRVAPIQNRPPIGGTRVWKAEARKSERARGPGTRLENLWLELANRQGFGCKHSIR